MPIFNSRKRHLNFLNDSKAKQKLEEKHEAEEAADAEADEHETDSDADSSNEEEVGCFDIEDDEEDFCQESASNDSNLSAATLEYTPRGYDSRPAVYSGSSNRTQYRKKQLLREASTGHASIVSYFASSANLGAEKEEEDDESNNVLKLDAAITLVNALPYLQNNQHNVKYPEGMNIPFEVKRATAVAAYFHEWRSVGRNFSKIKSSENIASHFWSESFFPRSSSSLPPLSSSLDSSYETPPPRTTPSDSPPTPKYRGELVRQWAKYFLKHGEFPSRTHGKHQKILPLILDEDVRNTVLTYLRSLNSSQRLQLTSHSLANWINRNVFVTVSRSQELPLNSNSNSVPSQSDEWDFDESHEETKENSQNRQQIHISPSTAQRWMKHLGFHAGEVKKGVYVDGHEREDVVKYRNNIFLPQMLALRKRMTVYSSISEVSRPPNLGVDEKELVWVVQDECTFATHDARKMVWQEDGRPPIRPKGQGRSIMVSEFLCPCHGRMQSNGVSTVEILELGASHEGYWDNKNVVKQLLKVIPIFNELHPGKTALFTFDNSTNHRAKAEDALVIGRLKLSDGFPSKRIKGQDVTRTQILRDGWFYNRDGNREIQIMLTADGKQKGIRTILQERGLWRDGMTAKEGRKLLSEQMDFKVASFSSCIKETIYSAGHQFLFFPKFHPELNPIELFWGWSKRYTRSNCDFSFEHLQKVVPQALQAVSLPTIRKFFNHCWRYMRAYSHSDGESNRLSLSQIEWAMKKFSSHRRVRDSTLAEMDFLSEEFLEGLPQK